MTALVSYIRVSTAQQGKSGLGIEAQREALARFAEVEGLDISAEFIEVETGKGSDALDRRPQLALALAEKRTRRRQSARPEAWQSKSLQCPRGWRSRSESECRPPRGERPTDHRRNPKDRSDDAARDRRCAQQAGRFNLAGAAMGSNVREERARKGLGSGRTRSRIHVPNSARTFHPALTERALLPIWQAAGRIAGLPPK